MNAKATLSACMSVTISRFTRSTDSDQIRHEDSRIVEEGHKLLFIPQRPRNSDKPFYADGVRGNTYYRIFQLINLDRLEYSFKHFFKIIE